MSNKLLLVRNKSVAAGGIQADDTTEKLRHIIPFSNMEVILGKNKDPKLLQILTKEGLYDYLVNTDESNSLMTHDEILTLIAQAVTENRVEILETTDIDNLTKSFDHFIKTTSKVTFKKGNIVSISYTGDDTTYIDKNGNKVIESFLFDGTNFKLWTDHIEAILVQDEQNKKIDNLDAKKADKVEVILKTGENTFDEAYTPTKQTDAETVKNVDDKITKTKNDINGTNATKTITELEEKDTTQDTRITALEKAGVSAYVKGISETVGVNQFFTNKAATGDADDVALGFKKGDFYGTLALPQAVDTPGWEPIIKNSKESFTYSAESVFTLEVYDKSQSNDGTHMILYGQEVQGNYIPMYGKDIYLKTILDDPRQGKSGPILVISNISNQVTEKVFNNYGIGRFTQAKSILASFVATNEDLVKLQDELNKVLKGKVDINQPAGALIQGVYQNATINNDVISKINEHSNNIVGKDLQAAINIPTGTDIDLSKQGYILGKDPAGKPKWMKVLDTFSAKSDATLYSKGQILEFHEEQTGTQYENGNLFDKILPTQIYSEIATLDSSVYSLAIDSQNNWYAGTDGNSVYKNGTKIATLDNVVLSLAIDSQNNWYAGTQGNSVYKNGTKIASLDNLVRSLAIDSQNNWYAGTDGNSVYKNGTKIATLDNLVLSLAIDSQNNWYAGTDGNSVYKNGTKIATLDNLVLSLAIDSQNNWYAGTQGNSVYKNGTKIATLDNLVLSLAIDSQNNWYAGTQGNSVYKNGTKIATLDNLVLSLAIDSQNNWYAGTYGNSVYKGIFNEAKVIYVAKKTITYKDMGWAVPAGLDLDDYYTKSEIDAKIKIVDDKYHRITDLKANIKLDQIPSDKQYSAGAKLILEQQVDGSRVFRELPSSSSNKVDDSSILSLEGVS